MLNFILGKGNNERKNLKNESNYEKDVTQRTSIIENDKNKCPDLAKTGGNECTLGLQVLIAFTVVTCCLGGLTSFFYINQPINTKQLNAFVQSKVFSNEVENIVKSYLSRTYPDLDTDYLR